MGSDDCIHDRFLIREAMGGSHAAFARLIRDNDHAVLKLALRITGSPSDAQDICQEAFLKAHRKLESFRFDCSFSTWIYRIVTNLCLDHLRRSRTRKEGGGIAVNAKGEDYDLLIQTSDDRPAHNPDQEFLRRELRVHIVRAMQRLAPHERIVFELKHFDGMKLRTISEILNTSEGDVRNSLIRATRKLRSDLAKYAGLLNASVKPRNQHGYPNQNAIAKTKKDPVATIAELRP